VVRRGLRTAVGIALLAALLIWGAGGGVEAQGGPSADWEPTGLGTPVLELFTPASGAFFATTRDALLRSEDAGATWAPVTLPSPPAGRREPSVAVDPTNHAVLYAAGAGGLYKSSDDAATWALLLPTTETVLRVAVSPADHHLVYLALAGSPTNATDFRFLRSRDGGATWQQLEEFHSSLCGWGVRLLEPHPTNAQRAFRTAGCYAGRNLGDALRQSTDQGATWSALFEPQMAFPARLVGGRAVAPGRYYLAANRDSRAGGSALFRTDDDGSTWAEVVAFEGGGTIQQPDAPDVRIGGLAYDPAKPDRVYVGLNEYADQLSGRTRTGSRVIASSDGGATWAELGRGDPGEISDLVLGIDGLNLYMATDQGLWRLRSP
jgi:photosystem II stability/assembly factor-like uncharacterized protein